MNNISIRQAQVFDSKEVFLWRNDELTRKMSHLSDLVQWETHTEWYEHSISQAQRLLLICEYPEEDVKVGMVRFDFDHEFAQATISINISPEQRSKGYAKACLHSAIAYVQATYPECKELSAEIKRINKASIHSFEGLGFKQKLEQADFSIYSLHL